MGKGIFIWILIVVFFVYLFGAPSSINIPGFGWDLNGKDETPIIINQPTESNDNVKRDIILLPLKARQEIYEPIDTAYVDIEIKNTLNVEYNITVEWYHNNIRYLGWFNKSTENYDTKIVDNLYWSAYGPLNNEGEWVVQTILKYEFRNKTVSKGKTTKFEVI